MSPARLVTALIACSLVLAACGPDRTEPTEPPAPDPDSVTLVLGFIPDVQFAPFYVAQQEGYYADAGLVVTIEHRTAADLVRLVASGEAEFGVADATDVMISRTSGIPVRYVSTLYERFPVGLIGEAGTVPDDAAGLEGLRIGTPGRFGSSWHALLATLEAGGLDEADVTIREYPQFNQVDGLAAGDVDLITGFRNNEPLRLAARGIEGEVLAIDEIVPLPGPGMIAGDALIEERPDLVSAFVEATARAQAAVIADPELGVIAAEADGVESVIEDRATAERVLRATVELWAGDDGFGHGQIDEERWRSAYETMERLGFIDGSVPLEEMIDPRVGAS
jgi:NitT/TauT family transport system substrate-binding protein